MYTAFYKMSAEPFPGRPTPDVFFKSKTHNQGLYFLLTGIKDQETFLLVTGEYGMGKSLLCLRFIRVLNKYKKYPYIYLSSPVYSYFEVLQRIARAYGCDQNGMGDIQVFQNNLLNYLEKKERCSPLIIVIDDMQDYSLEVLTRLKYLADYNIGGFFPFRFVFFSHPSLLIRLEEERFISLDQRIRRRYRLTPFNFFNTKEYIFFRLLESGAQGVPFFSDEAIEKIHEYTNGVPMLINSLCDICLLQGAAKEAEMIDPGIVAQSFELLSRDKQEQSRPTQTVHEEKRSEPTQPTQKDQTEEIDFTTHHNQSIGTAKQGQRVDREENNELHDGTGKILKFSAGTQAMLILLIAAMVFFLGLFFGRDLFGHVQIRSQFQVADEGPAICNKMVVWKNGDHCIRLLSLRPDTGNRFMLFTRQKSGSCSGANLQEADCNKNLVVCGSDCFPESANSERGRRHDGTA